PARCRRVSQSPPFPPSRGTEGRGPPPPAGPPLVPTRHTPQIAVAGWSACCTAGGLLEHAASSSDRGTKAAARNDPRLMHRLLAKHRVLFSSTGPNLFFSRSERRSGNGSEISGRRLTNRYFT